MNEWICEEVPAKRIKGMVVSTYLHKEQELVRCKDCKHFTDNDENGYGVCMRIMHGCQSWGFCADGERI